MTKKRLPLLDHSPWSPSKADLASRCGLAFKYRYIDKKETGPKGTAAKIGTTVHKAQELVLGDNTKPEVALEEAIKTAEDSLTHNEIEQVRTFTQSIIDFSKRLNALLEKHPAKKIILEERWAITPEFYPCKFFDNKGMIRGIVDLAILLESGHMIVIDHKSGKPRPLKYYGSQLDVYAIMAQAQYPDIKGVRCAVNFMSQDKVVWGNYKSREQIEQVLRPWLIDYLNGKANRVEGFEATTGYHCSWCDFKSICPEWVNDDEDGEDGAESRRT